MARWHFRMLNDSSRNFKFKKAIQYWIRKKGKLEVMDIGSGTGLLSMYAANVASVKRIYAVECSEIMAKIANEVFEQNARGAFVKLLTKHSTDLKVGEDIPSKVSLIISETLDSGVFGEGVLDTLIHAKHHLLKYDGVIVPWSVVVYVAGYKSMNLASNQILLNDTFQEYLFLDNFRLVARRDEPYDAEYVDKIADFKIVTNNEQTIDVEFNEIISMRQHFDGSVVHKFDLQSTVSNDYLDGFIVWFNLYLNDKTEHPSDDNIISTESKSGSCWPQAIFKLNERVLLEKDQVLELSLSCKDGILKIHHDLDINPEQIDLEVDNDALKFINDESYLRELEFTVSKHGSKFINCLDLSPFPYVGLMMLKDSRLDKLWCHKRNEQLIKKIALKNLIDEEKLVFIDTNPTNLCTKFELIIIHPFHPLGDLDSQLVCDYSKYKELLTANGLIIPQKITLFGELIHSDWLVDSCRITDVNVKRFKIDKFINDFATETHLDIDESLDCEKLTSAFKISEIFFDNELHESTVNVPMRNINLPIHAILYHHKIELTIRAPVIATNRKAKFSCFKRSAQVLPNEIYVDSASATVSFIQNSGIVKCDVVS